MFQNAINDDNYDEIRIVLFLKKILGEKWLLNMISKIIPEKYTIYYHSFLTI